MNSIFDAECQSLGLASAQAKLRLDEKAPQLFKDGFRSFKGAFTRPDYFEKKWLGLRLNAVKRGFTLDSLVTPEFLKKMMTGSCPVSLVSFKFEGQAPENPSVDRLCNDGTYAVANLAVFTQRVNRAKGSKSFEEILEIACISADSEGLLAFEWARLASLMYGAWDAYHDARDPYLLPLRAYPVPGTFSTQSQLVQLLLLRACTQDAWPGSLNVWAQVTRDAGQTDELLLAFMLGLHAAAQNCDYPPDAWATPEIFARFFAWYSLCKDAAAEMLSESHVKYQSGVDVDAMTRLWMVGGRQVQ